MTGLKKCCKLLECNGWIDITEIGLFRQDSLAKIYRKEELGVEVYFFCGEIDAMERIILYYDNGINYFIGGFDYYHLLGYLVDKCLLPFNFNDK